MTHLYTLSHIAGRYRIASGGVTLASLPSDSTPLRIVGVTLLQDLDIYTTPDDAMAFEAAFLAPLQRDPAQRVLSASVVEDWVAVRKGRAA